jgi:thioredoxin-dependent peroxiredoxin
MVQYSILELAAMALKLGDPAPNFKSVDDNGTPLELAKLKGPVLLVFYPKDNSPVCTAQLCEYRDGLEAFDELGIQHRIALSADDVASQQAFKADKQLPFRFVSDRDLSIAAAYDAKGMMGMKRAVFLIDSKQRIRYAHVEALALFRRTLDDLKTAFAAIDGL